MLLLYIIPLKKRKKLLRGQGRPHLIGGQKQNETKVKLHERVKIMRFILAGFDFEPSEPLYSVYAFAFSRPEPIYVRSMFAIAYDDGDWIVDVLFMRFIGDEW